MKNTAISKAKAIHTWGTLLFLLSLMACESARKPVQKDNSEKPLISQEMANDLQLAPVTSKPVENLLQITGKIAAYEDRQVRIAPLVNGIIMKVNVQLGDFVQKGQVVAVVKSTEVATIENDIISSKSDLLTAQKNLSVAEDMLKSGLASEKDVVIAQNELLKTQGSLQRAKEVSGIYGVKNSVYTLRSPISGYVIAKNPLITEQTPYRLEDIGDFFTIANLSAVQVVANVYETDIAHVKMGQEVDIKLVAYPDRIFKGNIDKVNNVLDPDTRTMQVRINILNPENILKPEMFATVTVHDEGKQAFAAVPAHSVVFDQNKHFVLVCNHNRKIESRQVNIATTDDEYAYVASGVKVGDRVVTKNQLMLYNALNQ